MMELTEQVAGGSLIVIGFTYVVLFIFSFYQLYLNWKQSKVADTQKEQIKLLIEIRDLLKKW